MEQTELAAVFDAHAPAVLAYLVRRTDRATAEDVLSETFLVAWRRRDAVPAQPLPWLYGVARKLLANQRRAAGTRHALLDRLRHDPTAHAHAGADPADATHARGPLLTALAELGERDREVLLLDAWEGLSREDGARVLGCRPATYGVRLHRARARLRVLLDAADLAAASADPTAGAPPLARPEIDHGRSAR